MPAGSRLKGELVVEGATFELLATNLSSHFLSPLISSCMGENMGTSFFLDDVDIVLASRWIRKSSSVFCPSWSKKLCAHFWPPLVRSFFCDPDGVADLGRRPDTASL